jgi:tetratricopeptide (TPR) repeat protein
MKRSRQRLVLVIASALLGGCAAPSPYQKPTQPPEQPSETPPAETRPGEPPSTVEEPQPLPATKNYAVAASSIERALRIEPDNPLLWIELGKVRFAEGNYLQAENMGRKAVSMSVNAPRAQSSAWKLIADSFRARGKNIEAQEAQARSDSLNRG